MADFQVNISNSLNVFQEATMWGTAEWGTSFWGYGSESAQLAIGKLVDGTTTFTDTLSITAGFNVTISNSFTGEFELTEERLRDGAGYSYVFTRPTLDGDERSSSSYTEITDGTTTWTAASATTTTWSET